MRSLYWRIYLTVVAALALFALVSGWVVQRHLDEQRVRAEAAIQDRMAAWGDLLERSLPGPAAPQPEQEAALREWSQRLRVPLALDSASGQRVAVSESFLRRQLDRPEAAGRLLSIKLDDGRTLWVPRPGSRRMRDGAARGGLAPAPGLAAPDGAVGGGPGMMPGLHGPGMGRSGAADLPPGVPPAFIASRLLPDGVGLLLFLGVLFLAVAGGAFPVVRRLTRRLEALKQGVEAFGAGQLHQRVAESGSDEVAAVGASFNRAATRIEALLRSHQSLLANASHELRSPLARLKMAVAMLEETPADQRDGLRREIHANIAELDALVEEVLLASRLDASQDDQPLEPVALLPLAAEEAARVDAQVGGDDVQVRGDERLLRRALRNLLENAQRYGGGQVEASVQRTAAGAELRVCDRGPGVPEVYRERIFEAFFRLPGHAEREGGVGLGLALVRQIAQRHGGSVRCEPRDGGGSCFVLSLPG
jgi:signal transduction histidine kinase